MELSVLRLQFLSVQQTCQSSNTPAVGHTTSVDLFATDQLYLLTQLSLVLS